MIAASHSATDARADNTTYLVATFTDTIGHLNRYLLISLGLTIIASTFLFNEQFQDFVGLPENLRGGDIRSNGLALAFSVFIIASIADLALVLRAILSRKPALIINEEGAQGFCGGVWRKIAWDEIEYLDESGGHLSIVAKPRGFPARFFFDHSHRGLWNRWKWERAIRTPIKRTDKSATDIRRAIARGAPNADYVAVC